MRRACRAMGTKERGRESVAAATDGYGLEKKIRSAHSVRSVVEASHAHVPCRVRPLLESSRILCSASLALNMALKAKSGPKSQYCPHCQCMVPKGHTHEHTHSRPIAPHVAANLLLRNALPLSLVAGRQRRPKKSPLCLQTLRIPGKREHWSW
jgi:hypothetical protein